MNVQAFHLSLPLGEAVDSVFGVFPFTVNHTSVVWEKD
jgi:hypothetical protein